MLVQTAGLLLAGLSFANAGIFQRQSECYPSAVTITASPAPAVPTVTETATITLGPAPQPTELDTTSTIFSVLTVTATAALPTFTITSTLTSFLTVEPSTVYQTITGLSSGSSHAQASGSDVALPTITYTSLLTSFVTVSQFTTVYQTTASLSSASQVSISSAFPTSSPKPYAGAQNTSISAGPGSSSHKSMTVETMTVVAVPVSQSQNNTDQRSSVPLNPPSEVSAAPTLTSTISLTSTDRIVTTLTIVPVPVLTTSSFPTLTVTGSMGITPGNGPATGGSSGLGPSNGTARSTTDLPLSSASTPASITQTVPLAPISLPPFANTTVSGGAASINATSVSTGGLTRRNKAQAKRGVEQKRQVGAIVTATVDGVVVSWTNTWDGAAPSTTAAPQVTPVIVTATIGGAIVSWTQTIEGTAAPISSATAPISSATAPISSATATISSTTSEEVTFTHGPGGPVTIAPPAAPLSTAASFLSVEGPPAYTPPFSATSELSVGPTSTPAGLSLPTSATSLLSTTTASSIALSTVGATNSSTSQTLSTSISSTTAASASTTCTSESTPANFTINFDDLPLNGEPLSSHDYPPFRNPYKGLYWSQGFSYAPPPSDPFPPHSGSQLGVFVVDGSANIHSLNWTGPVPNDTDVNGMFGAGPNFADPAFYIDAFGAWVGCQNAGSNRCQIQVSGYNLSEPSGELGLKAQQHFYQDPCTDSCTLQQLELSQDFRNLTAFQIQATIEGDGTPVTWYVDDIELAWTDNSCDSIETRNGATGALGFGGFIKRGGENVGHESITWKNRTPVAPKSHA